MQSLHAFNFRQWIDENRSQLKPPVGNKRVFRDGDFIIMVVGGPNARQDYHVDPGQEFFYQLEGDMVLRTMQDGQAVDVPIRAGEVLLIPPMLPHSPQRPANTVGLVIEYKRAENADDHMRWYCKKCGNLVHDAQFHLVDLGKQIKPIIEEFKINRELRKCKACGTVYEL